MAVATSTALLVAGLASAAATAYQGKKLADNAAKEIKNQRDDAAKAQAEAQAQAKSQMDAINKQSNDLNEGDQMQAQKKKKTDGDNGNGEVFSSNIM